jgi:hypothetical protein
MSPGTAGTAAKQKRGSSGDTAIYGKDAKVSRQPDNFERAAVRKKL